MGPVMTAKEALLERVEQLSEEEAAEWLARLADDYDEEEELSEEDMEDAIAGRRENERGESIPADQLFRRYGL